MKKGRINNLSLMVLVGVLIFSLYFVLAESGNLASSNAGNGTTIRMLWFNVSNTSSGVGGNNLTSITINQTVGGSNSNVTNVTLSAGTAVYYNDSCCTFPVVINVGNITASTNFTVNFTINASAKDAVTIQANVTSFVNESNVTFTALPYNSTLVTIDSLVPFYQYGSGTTSSANLSQSFIFVNVSANDTVSNLHTIVIYLYNSTINNSANASLSAVRAIHTYNFTNLIDGTYYINATVNDTYNHVNSTLATRTITLDTVAPTVTLPAYANGTFKRNTVDLTLNISITDATSGLGAGLCLVDVNGTNQSISISGGWCNSTSVKLTGLADGNKTIKVYVNDSANNLRLNDSFVVQIDTTVPGASSSCSPSSVYTGDTVTCTCSGTDATSGVASSTASSTPSTSNTGSFSYGCTVTDNAGNSASSTAAYTVSQSPGSGSGSSSGGGSSSSTASFWTKGTYSISEEEFKQGHSMNILPKQRVKIEVSSEDHYVGVKELTGTTAKIEVSSTPQEKILSIGEEWKVDVTGDNYYDLRLKLNSITDGKANVFATSIYEVVPQTEEPVIEQAAEEEPTPTLTGEATEGETGSARSLTWLWILIVVVLIIGIIVWVSIHKKHKR